MLREPYVGCKLAEENNIFGAAAKGEVLCFARAEGDARGFGGGVYDKGSVGRTYLNCVGGVGVAVGVAGVGGVCCGM